MNFKFALSVLSAGAIGAFANTIPWTIENADIVNVDPVKGNETANWQYVFLTQDTHENNGSNADVYGFDSKEGFNEGSWSDTNNTAADYIVALWDGTSSTYYALKDGSGNYVTVNSAAFDQGWNGGQGANPGASDAGAAAIETITANLASRTYTAAAVPEPATAALALVGVAMLVRRRK